MLHSVKIICRIWKFVGRTRSHPNSSRVHVWNTVRKI